MISCNFFSSTLSLGKRIFCVHPKLTLNSNLAPIPNATLSSVSVELPEKPKKPASGFLRFLKDRKNDIIKEHPDWKYTLVVKQCSQDWKNVHPTVKERYEREFKEEMEVYAKKFLDYSSKLSEDQRVLIKEVNMEKRENSKKRRVKKKLRELNKPKKPPTSFSMYLMDQAKIRNRKYNELMLEMKGEWEKLDSAEKERYHKKSAEAKATYLKELDSWEKKMLQEGHLDVIRVKTLEEKRPATAKKTKDETKHPTSVSPKKKSSE